jgi:hypothetical protein
MTTNQDLIKLAETTTSFAKSQNELNLAVARHLELQEKIIEFLENEIKQLRTFLAV